ncbi:type VII secretion protein EccB [Micromonospora sp. NPDC047730]|uniref:type VII secretion protein EccB n=1 Tax=Micromonospora sp. NPDC047730 TaxID=3364253 RepID=UPI003717526C
MWTQRDQLQAYQFLRRRLVSALQVGDANHPVSPSRRLVIGCALGAAVALLVTAGFGVYGFLRPGANTDWRKPGQVVLDKDTGAAYVMGTDGLLHPMLNYASARLLAGGDGTATSRVSSKSLARAPRGVPLGIPGAPPSLPGRDRLTTGPFTVCAQTADGRPAGTAPVTTALAGVPPVGVEVDAATALLVAGPDGTEHALVAGRRHRITDPATAVALGYDAVRPLPVSAAWLSAVIAGPDLRLITVAGVGAAGPRIGDRSTRVGQVLAATTVGTEPRYYLVHADGLLPIGQTEAALVLGNPANRAAYPGGAAREIPVTPADVAQSRPVAGKAADYPARLAPPAEAPQEGAAVCATVDGDRAVVRLGATTGVPAGAEPLAAGGGTRADRVFVPAGRAAVVRERPTPQAALGTVFLLTDQGVRYPVPDGDALKALGYGTVRPTPVPPTVLALFPVGPVLDPAAARRPATPGVTTPAAGAGEPR